MTTRFERGGLIGASLTYNTTDRYVVGTTAASVSYVGGTTAAYTGTTSDISISVSSLSIQTGDIIIVAFATGSTANRTIGAEGFTQVASLYSNDSYDTNLYVGYQVALTSVTSITLVGGTGSISDAGAAAVHVWRGIDTTEVISGSFVRTGTVANTLFPPLSTVGIDLTISNAVIIVAGAAAHSGGVDTFGSTDLSNFLTVGSNDSYDVSVGLGSYAYTGGTYTPAAWTCTQADSTSFSAAAVTFGLKPGIPGTPIYGSLKNSGMWDLSSTIYSVV